jgi:hypothetical protein
MSGLELPTLLFSPVAPSLLHERQFHLLLLKSQKNSRRCNSSEKNNKIRSTTTTSDRASANIQTSRSAKGVSQ